MFSTVLGELVGFFAHMYKIRVHIGSVPPKYGGLVSMLVITAVWFWADRSKFIK